ncbi:MAG: UDP-glucose/GDP-mannose dehydrogenase family protein [Candidatus Omnitrophica bacterium]|nr:UDP-glucose/GDP-mannose dehydrogenase family protein [Candidatus Omnitrophota bacterium]
MKKNIGIIGAGHVGLVTAGCFAKMGHHVVCADNDTKKIEKIKKSEMPFYEPGLQEMIEETCKNGSLVFVTTIAELAKKCDIIFIAVGTPSTEEGGADLSYVENVTVEIAKALTGIKKETADGEKIYKLIIEKSTVPVLTGEWVKRTLELMGPTGIEFDVAANPEFLREGNAIKDFMEPDRIVIGVESERARKIFEEIYASIKAPVIFTDVKSAELIKHASNSFLALKISYINAISQICERVGGDIEKVAEGMGYDKRIGRDFLKAGIGWGGSCFLKDVSAFIKLSEDIGYKFNLLKDVREINREQRLFVVKKAKDLLWNLKGKEIAVLGLSFKPDTDDVRDAPAIDIIAALLKEGASVKCYDPEASENMKSFFPDIVYCENPYSAAEDASLLIFLTEWDEFKTLDFGRLKKIMSMPHVIDGRNFIDAKKLKEAGFIYRFIGRDKA